MTTALENALAMEQEKFATDQMTPMQQGYADALRKLGYELKEGADYTRSQMGAMDPAKRQSMVAGMKAKNKPVTPGKTMGTIRGALAGAKPIKPIMK